MKTIWKYGIFGGLILLLGLSANAQDGGKTGSGNSNNKSSEMKQILIDRFVVPAAAREEFLRRMKINRDFIKNLPGFIEDAAYEQTGGDGSEFNFVTTAVWKNSDSLESAKREVFAFYQKQKFDMPVFLKRLNVKIERAIYRELKD